MFQFGFWLLYSTAVFATFATVESHNGYQIVKKAPRVRYAVENRMVSRKKRGLQLPIIKRGVWENSDQKYAREVALMRRKYGHYSHLEASELSKRENGEVSLISYDSILYATEITIGTPPQSLLVQLDTGSSDLVIETEPCKQCSRGPTLYDPSASKTVNQTNQKFEIEYADGSGASGLVVTDTVGFAGFSVDDIGIGAVTKASDSFSMGNTSGLLGLGFASESQSNSVPILQYLAWGSDGTSLLDDPVFSFSIDFDTESTLQSGPTRVTSGGVLTIGKLDDSLYQGNITYTEVTPGLSAWSIPLDDIVIGGKSTGLSAPQVIIDTGSTLMGFPQNICAQIYKQLPGGGPVPNDSNGYYQYDCSDVEVSFVFSGVPFTIPSAYFNRGRVSGSNKCYGAISYLDTGDDEKWLIGDAFIGAFFVVFQFGQGNSDGEGNPSIGFAQHSQSSSAIPQPLSGSALLAAESAGIASISNNSLATPTSANLKTTGATFSQSVTQTQTQTQTGFSIKSLKPPSIILIPLCLLSVLVY